jgi:hypothetical protein
MQGWIQLHRSFLEWEWYECPNTSRLFIHCLLKANHKDKKWRGTIIKRGSFLTSRESLSTETGLSQQNIRTCISKLKSTGELTSKSTSKSTMITICKYDTYQNLCDDTNQQLTSELTNDKPATNQRLTTTNNDNNIKNEEKRERKREHFEEVTKKYFREIIKDMSEFANFVEYWGATNEMTDQMRWQEDPYFISNLSGKIRRWMDNAGKSTKDPMEGYRP